jgi:hypothetical protein
MAQHLPGGAPEPQVGLIRSLDDRDLVVQMPGSDHPKVFSRTAETVVGCDGQVLQWGDLEVGQAVRFRSVQGVFDPPTLTSVEVLQGLQAEAIRREVQGLGPTCRCPAPNEAPQGARPHPETPR